MKDSRYYKILRQRWWLIVLCVVVCVGATYGLMKRAPAEWKGIARVSERSVNDRGVKVFPDAVVMQANEMHLRDLAMVAMSVTVRQNAAMQFEGNGISLDAGSLLQAMKVEVEPQTNVLRIELTQADPETATEAVKILRDEFVKYYRQQLVQPTADSRRFLEAEVNAAKKTLKEKQLDRERYQMDHEVIQVDAQTQSLIQRTAEVERYLIESQAAADEAKSRLAVIDKKLEGQPETKISQQTTTDNPIYQSLLKEKVDLETELGAMMTTKGSKHPAVAPLKKKIEEIDSKMEPLAKKIVSQVVKSDNPVHSSVLIDAISADATRAGAEARSAAIASALSDMQAKMSALPQAALKMAQYDLDVDAAATTYKLLLQKLNEAKIREKEAVDATAFYDVDEPFAEPVQKKTNVLLALALGLSLVLGCGLVFLLEYLDNSVKSPADAERVLGYPVLSVVPKKRMHNLAHRSDDVSLLSAFEMIPAALSKANGSPASSVLVASADPEMGRTSTAVNLAVSLAQDGARVVLVDGDMRKPTMHEVFGTSNKPGLSNVLAGTIALEDSLVPTKIEGLLLLPAGPAPNSPIRLLRSAEMANLVKQVASLADYVIFDSPAGSAYADASVIAAYTDTVLLSHCAGLSPTGSEVDFNNKLKIVGARVAGIVLNNVKAEYSKGFRRSAAYSVGNSGADLKSDNAA